MTTGYVSQLHALFPVTFRLPNSPDLTIDFVVDTGFTGELTLPLIAVERLGLPFFNFLDAKLANDEQVELPLHDTATILWHDTEMEVQVLATGTRPLLGTALLAGSDFSAQFAEGGSVSIEPL